VTRWLDCDDNDLLDEYAEQLAAGKRRPRCGGFSAFEGPCGGPECADCYPDEPEHPEGRDADPPTEAECDAAQNAYERGLFRHPEDK
jgi:hypothetical protein